MVPRRSRRIASEASFVMRDRYGRSEVSASKQSTTDRMRAPMGMSVPRSPSGYPVPSQFSWWCRTIGTTGYGKSIDERISAPIGACSFIFSNSAGVSLPGLLRMCSGTAILPVSCSRPPASMAFSVSSSVIPSSRARPTAAPCTRRMWPCVTSSFASIAVASVSTVDRYMQVELLDVRFESSRRPNDDRRVR